MSLFVVLECRLSIKPYGKDYLKILFEHFIKKFDISNDNCKQRSGLPSFFINSFTFLINDKNEFDTMILKLRL